MGVPYAEVIGDPIAHSKSPLIHKFWLEKLGIEGGYRGTRIRPEELKDYFSSRLADPDWRGCNVTMPVKTEVLRHLYELDAQASRIGAVNCISRADGGLFGSNTDVAGIREVLESRVWRANTVTLIGAGGAARAALEVLRQLDTLEVLMIVRSPEKARPLHQAFARSGGVYPLDNIGAALAGSEYVINASPLGMAGAASMPGSVLTGLQKVMSYATVFDMVYAPAETELLKVSQALSLHTVSGIHMLIAQAAEAFETFFGHPAPREHDAELRELLTR